MFAPEFLEVNGTYMQKSSHVTAIFFLLQSVHEQSTKYFYACPVYFI